MLVYFEAKNKSLLVASKWAHGAVPESARFPAAAHDGIRAQALIQCYTGGMSGNVYVYRCLICETPVVNGLDRVNQAGLMNLR